MLKPEQVESLRVMQAAIEHAARLVGVVNQQVETCGIAGLAPLKNTGMSQYYHAISDLLELNRMAVARFRRHFGSGEKAA